MPTDDYMVGLVPLTKRSNYSNPFEFFDLEINSWTFIEVPVVGDKSSAGAGSLLNGAIYCKLK